jgi:hypothetical protein
MHFKLPLVSPNISCSQRPRQPFRRSIQFRLLRLGPSGYGAVLPDAIFMIPCRRLPRHVGAYLIKIFGALSNNTACSRTFNVDGSAWKVRRFESPQITPSTLKMAADAHKTMAHIYNTTRRRIPQDVSLIFPALENSDLIVPEITSLNYTRSETRL